MVDRIIFDPLLPISVIWTLAAVALVILIFATYRRLAGWWLRGLSLVGLLLAISNPSVQSEDREPLSDIVVAIVDKSASQRIGLRESQSDQALSVLQAEMASRPNTELKIVELKDGEGDSGTELMSALSDALDQEPRDRVAGAILITDGQLHDLQRAPSIPAPLHVLLSGQPEDWDRRLIIKNAPSFAIIGEETNLGLKIEDQGAVPPDQTSVSIEISVDGNAPQTFEVPLNQELTLPVTLEHGGRNVIQFTVPMAEGELTDRNNSAVIQINGVRDRLRVLLVSGKPHAGERTWRNLLKSDSAVDLVHFTILRPPDKQDGVPVTELSLIAFPTRELFLEKIDEFDLIIFDRYKRRGILPSLYLQNVGDYIREGGAVLLAAGPDFASADSLFRSPLAEILPAAPTSRVIEEGFTPEITDLGDRHPVTRGLEDFAPEGGWGQWLRQIELGDATGHVVMTGADDSPLLVLQRVGEGRVALLGSDQAWLWSRGFEGGGPQLELLRRLAHWMMKEPDLEEEVLTATAAGQTLTINRRTLAEEVGEVSITGPDGEETILPLDVVGPGEFQTTHDVAEIGLYRLAEGDAKTVIGVGPSAPREFEETIATGEKLEEIVTQTRGGVLTLSDGAFDVRNVRAGRPAAGRGWIGITPREAYLTKDIQVSSLLPAWAFLTISALLMIGAWLLEGRGSSRSRPSG